MQEISYQIFDKKRNPVKGLGDKEVRKKAEELNESVANVYKKLKKEYENKQ